MLQLNVNFGAFRGLLHLRSESKPKVGNGIITVTKNVFFETLIQISQTSFFHKNISRETVRGADITVGTGKDGLSGVRLQGELRRARQLHAQPH